MMVLLLTALASASTPASPPRDPHAKAAPAHGKAKAAGPGAEGAAAEGGHAAGGHGGGGHGHHYYTDDDDHDGTANWMDPTNGSEPNTDTYVLQSVGLHTFNLLVLVGIAAWFVRRPIGDFFRERALEVRNELTESARKRDEAHQRHQEILARLARLDAEIEALEQGAQKDAAREEEQLVERARREAARIAEQAERNVRDEVARARTALRAEAVELAVKLAESTLRAQTTADDQRRLARAFLDSVRSDAGGPRV